MAVITKINIVIPILLFLGYILTHFIIGKLKDIETKEDNKKMLLVIFKWYPAAYLIFVLFVLYSL